MILNNNNYILYAIKNYENPNCKGLDDFHNDLAITSYILRLLKRCQKKKQIKEQLLINHIIIFFNLFGVEAAIKLLFFKIPENLWPEMKTFLVFLNFMPEKIEIKENIFLYNSEIPLIPELIDVLRKI